MTKTMGKERILKATREKQYITYKGTPIKLSADFFQGKLCRQEGIGMIYLKWWKGKAYNQQYSKMAE